MHTFTEDFSTAIEKKRNSSVGHAFDASENGECICKNCNMNFRSKVIDSPSEIPQDKGIAIASASDWLMRMIFHKNAFHFMQKQVHLARDFHNRVLIRA